jgi:hypothetical protein
VLVNLNPIEAQTRLEAGRDCVTNSLQVRSCP